MRYLILTVLREFIAIINDLWQRSGPKNFQRDLRHLHHSEGADEFQNVTTLYI